MSECCTSPAPNILSETLRLPDMVPMPEDFAKALGRDPATTKYLEPGLYDARGNKLGGIDDVVPEARVVIEFAGVTFVWGVFSRPLDAGEQGWLSFTNIPGTTPITPFFSEWDHDRCVPRIGDALLPLLSAQRGRDCARVAGRNDFRGPVPAAAGYIVAQDLDLPPRPDGGGDGGGSGDGGSGGGGSGGGGGGGGGKKPSSRGCLHESDDPHHDPHFDR